MNPATQEAISILRKAKKAKALRFSEIDLQQIFSDIRSLDDAVLLATPEKKRAASARTKDPLLGKIQGLFGPVTGTAEEKSQSLLAAAVRRGHSVSSKAKSLGPVVKALRKTLSDDEITLSAEDAVAAILASNDMHETIR